MKPLYIGLLQSIVSTWLTSIRVVLLVHVITNDTFGENLGWMAVSLYYVLFGLIWYIVMTTGYGWWQQPTVWLPLTSISTRIYSKLYLCTLFNVADDIMYYFVLMSQDGLLAYATLSLVDVGLMFVWSKYQGDIFLRIVMVSCLPAVVLVLQMWEPVGYDGSAWINYSLTIVCIVFMSLQSKLTEQCTCIELQDRMDAIQYSCLQSVLAFLFYLLFFCLYQSLTQQWPPYALVWIMLYSLVDTLLSVFIHCLGAYAIQNAGCFETSLIGLQYLGFVVVGLWYFDTPIVWFQWCGVTIILGLSILAVMRVIARNNRIANRVLQVNVIE